MTPQPCEFCRKRACHFSARVPLCREHGAKYDGLVAEKRMTGMDADLARKSAMAAMRRGT